MMKIGGKSPSNKVTPFAVSEKGETLIKRIWECKNHEFLYDYVNYKWESTGMDGDGNPVEKYSSVLMTDSLDVSNWGFVSFRILHSTINKTEKDKDGNITSTYTAPVKINLYGDRKADDFNWVKTKDGKNIEIVAPSGTEITVIPEELPVLNYLQTIRARLEIDLSKLRNEQIQIKETYADGSSKVETVSVVRAAEKTIEAAKKNITVSPKVEIKAYINFNVITKR